MDLSNHIVTNIQYSDPKWLSFRLEGIGGSEVSTLFPETTGGEYNNPTRMYYEKIGWIPVPKFNNEAMSFGRWLEEIIADRWQYFDNQTDEFGQPNYLKNYEDKNIVRKCRRLNGYIQCKDWPWLFGSVDRIINIGSVNMITGAIMDKEGILECKTISGYVADKWISSIPLGYIYQVQQYMLILGLTYTEIALLKDGRYFSVLPIERSDVICNQIVEKTWDFWNNRVVPGKKLVKEYRKAEKFGVAKDLNDIEAAIMDLEPLPTAGDSYKEFLKDKFKTERTEAQGNSWQYSLCRQYEVLNYICKKLDGDKSLIYNSILNEIRKSGSNQLTFENGYVRFNKKLTNHITVKLDKPAIDNQIEILNSDFTL